MNTPQATRLGIMQRRVLVLVALALPALVVGCGGSDSDDQGSAAPTSTVARESAASNEQAGDEESEATESPNESTAAPTATQTPAPGPTEAETSFSDLDPATRERLDAICFDAVVNERFVGDLPVLRNRALAGELLLPPAVVDALEEASGDGDVFAALIAPICSEIGWQP